LASRTTNQGKSRGPDNGRASARKRHAILNAATEVFLENGYLGTNMDEVADRAGVSKQTVYNHFSDKENLFIEIVTRMTNAGSDAVQSEAARPEDQTDVAAYLRDYAYRQLRIVLTPRLMQLRRVVIGEVSRFPDLGRALYDGGPGRAIAALAATLAELEKRRLLVVGDTGAAATWLNWLIMSEPINRAMLLGDAGIPTQTALRRHADEAVRIFLVAYRAK
jgi:TetR/AcrR family transcriptional regulator, mexJK operon transcriptional repressor